MADSIPNISRATSANTNNNSLRTIIPKEIRVEFGLKPNNVLIWKIVDNKIVITKLDY